MCELEENWEIPHPILILLNRLSDFLFVAARFSSKEMNIKETIVVF